MKVSIAMASYNGAAYLEQQLNSFVKQKRLPDELIICDDGSSDKSVDICERFASSAPFEVHVVKNKKNLGYTQNFAKALSSCSGDLVFLSDQDDVWKNDKIEKIVESAKDNPNAWVIVHDGLLTREDGSSSGVTKMNQIHSGYGAKHKTITGALSAFRKEFLEAALPIPEGVIGHDVWLHELSALFVGRRVELKEILQTIRRHNSNTSEWVVNQAKSISPFDVFRAQIKTIPAEDYKDRILLNRGLKERLGVWELQSREGKGNQDKILADLFLDAEFQALMSRSELVQAAWLIRKIKAIKMLFCGHYRFFNGVRSFMRDLVR